MLGIVFNGNRQVELQEFADPVAGPGEVVVRVMASGMCGSDLHFYRAPHGTTYEGRPMIQGHEPCGVVEQVGAGVPDHAASVGDRVMIHHYWGCGVCAECRSGWPQLCTRMAPRIPTLNEHGGHAELIKVPAIQTMPLPAELSFRAGAAIGCGTGTAWGALERVGDVAGRDLLVLGQGPVGLSVTMLAVALGARVIATDVAPRRLEQARRFGAHDVVDVATDDAVARVSELTRGRGPHVVIETSGNSAAAAQGLELVATWGTMCVVGVGADVAFNTRDTMRRQLTLMTSWTLSTVQQLRCADFVVERGLPVADLFTHGWPLARAAEAYRWFDAQDAGKGVFEP